MAEHFQGLEDEEEEEEEDGQPDGEEEGQGGGASEDELCDEEDDEDDDQNGTDQQHQKVSHVMSCHVVLLKIQPALRLYECVRYVTLCHVMLWYTQCVMPEQKFMTTAIMQAIHAIHVSRAFAGKEEEHCLQPDQLHTALLLSPITPCLFTTSQK